MHIIGKESPEYDIAEILYEVISSTPSIKKTPTYDYYVDTCDNVLIGKCDYEKVIDLLEFKTMHSLVNTGMCSSFESHVFGIDDGYNYIYYGSKEKPIYRWNITNGVNSMRGYNPLLFTNSIFVNLEYTEKFQIENILENFSYILKNFSTYIDILSIKSTFMQIGINILDIDESRYYKHLLQLPPRQIQHCCIYMDEYECTDEKFVLANLANISKSEAIDLLQSGIFKNTKIFKELTKQSKFVWDLPSPVVKRKFKINSTVTSDITEGFSSHTIALKSLGIDNDVIKKLLKRLFTAAYYSIPDRLQLKNKDAFHCFSCQVPLAIKYFKIEIGTFHIKCCLMCGNSFSYREDYPIFEVIEQFTICPDLSELDLRQISRIIINLLGNQRVYAYEKEVYIQDYMIKFDLHKYKTNIPVRIYE